MNKRIRKKHHLGEFAVKCFAFKVVLNPDLSKDERELWDLYIDKIIDVIEANHCLMGGGFEAVVEADTYSYKDMLLTDEIKQKIARELSAIEGVSRVLASPLFDGNYETYCENDLLKIELNPDLTEQQKKWFLKYSR